MFDSTNPSIFEPSKEFDLYWYWHKTEFHSGNWILAKVYTYGVMKYIQLPSSGLKILHKNDPLLGPLITPFSSGSIMGQIVIHYTERLPGENLPEYQGDKFKWDTHKRVIVRSDYDGQPDGSVGTWCDTFHVNRCLSRGWDVLIYHNVPPDTTRLVLIMENENA